MLLGLYFTRATKSINATIVVAIVVQKGTGGIGLTIGGGHGEKRINWDGQWKKIFKKYFRISEVGLVCAGESVSVPLKRPLHFIK